MRKTNNRFFFADILKALAALIIVNSHFDSLYPIPALATGGAIGNAIFFAVSGFLLFPIKQSAGEWMKKKLINIYIPLVPMTVISLFTVKYGVLTKTNIVAVFVWPTIYWFAGAIILFYILYYLLRRVISHKAFATTFSILVIIYFAYYILLLDTSDWVVESGGLSSIEGCFKLIYYFMAMMIGKWFKVNSNRPFLHKRVYLLHSIISFGAIYAVKFLMVRVPAFYSVQFLNQFCILWLVCSVFCFMISYEPLLREKITGRRGINAVICFLGSHTLEMYLVQFIVIDCCAELSFPVNTLAAMTLIIGAAHLLYQYTGRIKRLLKQTDNGYNAGV